MKRIQWTLIAAAAAMLTLSSAHAAFLVSEKEVLRQARVEWLSMKRHLPLEPDERGVPDRIQHVPREAQPTTRRDIAVRG